LTNGGFEAGAPSTAPTHGTEAQEHSHYDETGRAPSAAPESNQHGGTIVSQSEQKIVQYLNEAHGSELALLRQLQAQIAMTPSGSYRDGLEKHLR
jgi:hypothetical protein